MASLPLIKHHHLNPLFALQSTTTKYSPKVFNGFPSSIAPLPAQSLITHQHPSIHSTTPKTPKVFHVYQSTANEETSELKQSPEEYQVDCEAWRFGVETNTLRSWTVVPPICVEYVKSYMVGSGSQYVRDSDMVADESIAYVSSLQLSGDEKDAWVFDVDDTLISTLPYFAAHQFGGEVIDVDDFKTTWLDQATAPALPASHRLYTRLLELGFKIFLITGRYHYHRNVTERNLVRAGYHSWEGLFLREPEDYETSAVVYKSEKRLKIKQDGFRIRGNSGDQWSDLTGYSVGNRTFKLPNLMHRLLVYLQVPFFYGHSCPLQIDTGKVFSNDLNPSF